MAKNFGGAKLPAIPAKQLGLLLLAFILASCSGLRSHDSALKQCKDDQAKLWAELEAKDARLQKFNQINPDGSLKTPALKEK